MKACLARVKRAACKLWSRGPGETSNSDNDAVQSDSSGIARGAVAKMGGLSSKEAKEVEHIIREFIMDELKYVQALDLVEELFLEPLRTATVQEKFGLVNGGDFVYQVFANWSSIRSLHRDVATKLLEACTTARPAAKTAAAGHLTKAGGAPAESEAGKGNFNLDPAQAIKLRSSAHRMLPQIFVEFVPFFKIYSEFLNVQGGHLSTSDDNNYVSQSEPPLLPRLCRYVFVTEHVLVFTSRTKRRRSRRRRRNQQPDQAALRTNPGCLCMSLGNRPGNHALSNFGSLLDARIQE